MIRVLKAEVLKYHRTSALIITLGIPLILTLLSFIIFLGANNLSQGAGKQEISALINNTSISLWMNMALPMVIGVLASQVVSIERDHLKQILIQPIARWQIFIVKILTVLTLISLSSLALSLGSSLVMLSAQVLDPSIFVKNLSQLLKAALGALPLIILGVGISFWFKGPLAIGTAILGTIIGPIVLMHQHAWKFFPWSLHLALIKQNDLAIWLILAFTLVFMALGLWMFSKYEPR